MARQSFCLAAVAILGLLICYATADQSRAPPPAHAYPPGAYPASHHQHHHHHHHHHHHSPAQAPAAGSHHGAKGAPVPTPQSHDWQKSSPEPSIYLRPSASPAPSPNGAAMVGRFSAVGSIAVGIIASVLLV